MPHTTGDLQWNEKSGRWEPIGGNPIPPYVPQGDTLTLDARASMRKELERQGLPIPAHLVESEPEAEANAERELGRGGSPAGLRWPPAPNPDVELQRGGQHELATGGEQGEAPPVVSLGGTRHVVEGGDDAELGELGDELPPVDRLGELEQPRRAAHDTDRPPPRRGRHR